METGIFKMLQLRVAKKAVILKPFDPVTKPTVARNDVKQKLEEMEKTPVGPESSDAVTDEKPVTLSTAQRHRINPFMNEAKVEVKGKKRFYSIGVRGDLHVDGATGEVRGTVEHRYVRMVDDAQFTKVFASGAAAIYQLGTNGRTVLWYLMGVVQQNPSTDRIYLSFMDAAEEPFHISKATFYRGMAELIDRQFIAPSVSPNMFFLNPMMIFNGDRFAFVQEFVKRSSATERDIALASECVGLEADHVAGMMPTGEKRDKRKRTLRDAEHKTLEAAKTKRLAK